ncbi:MAG: hypothetical protein RI988_2021 [Pseudomonadota bacterium]|jgi:hypothetical protein
MDDLVQRLEAEHARNGGQGAYAWSSRELCGKAAAEIRSLREQVAQERAGIVAWLRETADMMQGFSGPSTAPTKFYRTIARIADAIERHEDKEPRA